MENLSKEFIKKIFDELESRAGNLPDRSLKRMNFALEALGITPIKVINVVGTNGKGTVASGLFEILEALDLKVGLYTSPHLQRYGERIKTKKGEISERRLVELIIKVNDFEKNVLQNFGPFTYFEVLTLVAMLYFKAEGIEIAVIEAGVGGRYDATKAISESFLQIITSISIDHTSYLGTSIEEIAKHKAGILNGSTALTLNQSSALDIIEEEAKKTSSKLYSISDFKFYQNGTLSNMQSLPISGEFQVSFLNHTLTINPKQFGLFRSENYALVIAGAILALNYLHIPIDAKILNLIEQVVDNSFWIGRTQTISNNPLIILDGAHNVDAINKLYSSVSSLPHKRIISIIAMMDTKQHEISTRIIRKASDVMIVSNNGDSKSVSLEILMNESKADFACYDIEEAIYKAVQLANNDDVIVICGSLYLVGMVLDLINKKGIMR